MDRYPARPGWSAGVAATACRAADSRVQVGQVPGPLEPDPQGDAEVGQHRGAAGVVGRGGRHRLLAGGDRGVQVSPVPGPLEPDPQGDAEVGQHRGAAGVVGRAGRHRLFEQADSRIQVGPVPVRSNRIRRAMPRLDRYMARPGWSAGVAATACWPAVIAASRSARLPGPLEPAPATRGRGWTASRRGRGGRPGWPPPPAPAHPRQGAESERDVCRAGGNRGIRPGPAGRR